jgi:hypothetical protein
MSWEIFKRNILRYSNNPESIQDIDQVAKFYAREYDLAIKRGYDPVNLVPFKKGNVQAMEKLFKIALKKGLNSTGPYDLVGEMGKGVIAYWGGALLNELPIPILPSPGAISNVSVVSNLVLNPGTWIAEPSTADLLRRIPDNNNTVDGLAKVLPEMGPEIINDAGDPIVPELASLKASLPVTSPLYPISDKPLESFDAPMGDVQPFGGNSKPTQCGVKLDYDDNLSPNYRVRDLSIGTLFPHKLKAQAGFDIDGIVCNLRHVAINILEPLRRQYPSIRVNSAFRGTPSVVGTSQHEKGEAVDIQIPGLSPRGYIPIANWVKANLPFDQMIFEHGNTIWLHISCSRTKTVQRNQTLTMFRGRYEPGLRCYY